MDLLVRVSLCCLGIVSAGLLACAEPAEPEEPMHIVWVVLDAAAARQFEQWGAQEASSPELAALSSDATLFLRAIAQWPATLSSTSSFLTGRYPNPLVPPQKLAEPGIATLLRGAGWRTVGFSENPNVSEAHGFAREFGEFHMTPARVTESGWHDVAWRDTAATISRSLDWIDAAGPDPFFVYLHLLPPHAPYTPPKPFRGMFRDPSYRGDFDGRMKPVVEVMQGQRRATTEDLRNLRLTYLETIAYGDYQLGRLVAGLRERSLLDRTLLIVSSDHGEAFGEHDKVFHGANLHDEQLHVPLVIRFPESLGVAPGVVEEPVELADLVPTVLDAAGLPPLEDGGQSLLRVATGEERARGSARSWLTLRSKLSASLIGYRFKLIVRATDGVRELYDLRADPWELTDISAKRPGVVARLEERLVAGGRTLRSERVELDPALRKQLQAIGYVDFP